MPYAIRVLTGDTGMIVEPCLDCGHSLLDHWTPGKHPCTLDDCLCPAWQEALPHSAYVFVPFPARFPKSHSV